MGRGTEHEIPFRTNAQRDPVCSWREEKKRKITTRRKEEEYMCASWIGLTVPGRKLPRNTERKKERKEERREERGKK